MEQNKRATREQPAVTADLHLDHKLIKPEDRLEKIRIYRELHPVLGGQPTDERDNPNDNNTALDLACTIKHDREKTEEALSGKLDTPETIGDGPAYMLAGAGGVITAIDTTKAFHEYDETMFFRDNTDNSSPNRINMGMVVTHPRDPRYKFAIGQTGYSGTRTFTIRRICPGGDDHFELLHDQNTYPDKSGFLRASGSANALTESDRTSSLGTSTTLVASQKLVNDVSTRTTTAQNRANDAYTLANSKWSPQSTVGTGNIVRKSITDSLDTRVTSAHNRADSAYNLANSKWSPQDTIGSGKLMREGAFGVGSYLDLRKETNKFWKAPSTTFGKGTWFGFASEAELGFSSSGTYGSAIINGQYRDKTGGAGSANVLFLSNRIKYRYQTDESSWSAVQTLATTADSDRAYDRANDARTRAINAQSRADSAYSIANKKTDKSDTAALGNAEWTSWKTQESGGNNFGYGGSLSYALSDVPANAVVCRAEYRPSGSDRQSRVQYRRIIRTGK